MRPLFEYAAAVWDNCTEFDKNRLKNYYLKQPVL